MKKTPALASRSPLPRPAGQLDLLLKEDEPQLEVGTSATESTRRVVKQASIQDALLVEGRLAVKLSVGCQSLAQLNELLLKNLGQNSLQTRRRYAQSIIRWVFSDGIAGLLPRVWRAYDDESIMTDLLRCSYLAHEPVMAACIADALFPFENGIT